MAALTATEAIDMLAEQVAELVMKVNAGQELTHEQFAAAHQRTFAVALPAFLARLAEARPELAERVRVEFVREQAARMGAE